MECVSDCTLGWGTGRGVGWGGIYGTKGNVVFLGCGGGGLFLFLFNVFESGNIDLPVFAGVRNF